MADPKAYLQEADEKLEAAQVLLDNGFYDDSVSRSYYAIYNAATAALNSRDMNAKTHSGLISLFSKEFVKSGDIEVEIGKAIAYVEEQREKADYEPLIDTSKEDAESIYSRAEEFVYAVTELIENKK